MTRDQGHWWRCTAQSLSRAGLVWLALTAVALGSLVSSSAGLASSARLVAASSVGSTGKLKAGGPGAPTSVPGEWIYRAQGPDADAKRIPASGMAFGLVTTAVALSGPAGANRPPAPTEADKPAFKPGAFNARAPPALA